MSKNGIWRHLPQSRIRQVCGDALVEEGSDRIPGAHIAGHHGEDLIHFFALAMRHGIIARALKEGVFAFPTVSADLKSLF